MAFLNRVKVGKQRVGVHASAAVAAAAAGFLGRRRSRVCFGGFAACAAAADGGGHVGDTREAVAQYPERRTLWEKHQEPIEALDQVGVVIFVDFKQLKPHVWKKRDQHQPTPASATTRSALVTRTDEDGRLEQLDELVDLHEEADGRVDLGSEKHTQTREMKGSNANCSSLNHPNQVKKAGGEGYNLLMSALESEYDCANRHRLNTAMGLWHHDWNST